MAITTMQSAAANMGQPNFFRKGPNATASVSRSLWGESGFPAAGSYNATLNGVTLSSSSAQVTGQIYFKDPASGNAYLAKMSATPRMSNKNGQLGLILADRLWHNGGYDITSTAAQNSTTPTWPARDANGSTNGVGVFLGLEVSSTTGSANPTITVSYTNSDGVSGRSAVNVITTGSVSQKSDFHFIGLQAGDIGVQSVQSLTLSTSWISGTMNLVAYRPLGFLTFSGVERNAAIDALTGGFPRLYNGSVPFFISTPAVNANPFFAGSISWTYG